jgi:hypothetical protein
VSRYTIIIPVGAPPWAMHLQAQFNDAFNRIAIDIKPRRIMKAALPTDDSERIAIVPDEVGGEVLAFFDSAGVWRRTTDLATVS